jgi:hypothetical protein
VWQARGNVWAILMSMSLTLQFRPPSRLLGTREEAEHYYRLLDHMKGELQPLEDAIDDLYYSSEGEE